MRDAVLAVFVLAATAWAYRVVAPIIWRALRSGRWSMNGAIFDLAERPVMYCSAILMFSLFMAVMAAVSYAAILNWLDR
jgi:hypothetical protein